MTAGAVTHVEVEASDGSLLVRWDVEGEPMAVDVASGISPDHVDHRHETTVPAGTTETRLTAPPGRSFVSVAPAGGGPAVVAGERRLPFTGAVNFRDLGGYPADGGRRVRWGRVFRADSMHALTPADLDLYHQLGMTQVFDLRGEQERIDRPNPFTAVPVPILTRPANDTIQDLERLSAADGEKVLERIYTGALDNAAPQIGTIFTGMARADGLPALFHCHAGKDRTGIVAALLLDLLGVDRQLILDDYELTTRYRGQAANQGSFDRMIASGMSPEAAAGVLTTPRWAMESALRTLDDRHGGIGAWLAGPAGVRPDDSDRLRAALLG